MPEKERRNLPERVSGKLQYLSGKTGLHVSSRKPTFISVLSGKITTVYDLEELL